MGKFFEKYRWWSAIFSKFICKAHQLLTTAAEKLYFIIIINAEQLLLQRAIYKTRNTGTGNGMQGMRATRGMFTKIPGNLLEDSGECYYFNIPGNVPEDSRECWRRFRGMFKRIPGNVPQDSGECSKRFRGMFEEIPGNVQEDSGECSKRFWGMFKKISWNLNLDLELFCEILLIFYQILQLKC